MTSLTQSVIHLDTFDRPSSTFIDSRESGMLMSETRRSSTVLRRRIPLPLNLAVAAALLALLLWLLLVVVTMVVVMMVMVMVVGI